MDINYKLEAMSKAVYLIPVALTVATIAFMHGRRLSPDDTILQTDDFSDLPNQVNSGYTFGDPSKATLTPYEELTYPQMR